MAQENDITLVNFHRYLHGSSQEKREIASAVDAALARDGILYLNNHGIDQNKIDACFFQSRRFFGLAASDKEAVAMQPAISPAQGYFPVSREKIRGQDSNKESFDWGYADNLQNYRIWPPEDLMPGFRNVLESFQQDCYALLRQLLECLSLALDLPPHGQLGQGHYQSLFNCSLIHYPAVRADVLRSGKLPRLPVHSDFGTLTLLFQDNVGGLEVAADTKSVKLETSRQAEEYGRFRGVDPIPGTVVVNAGYLLMRWSNGRWKNALHRVSTPQPRDQTSRMQDETAIPTGDPEELIPERYSVAVFGSPDPSVIIEALPGCWGDDQPKRWKPLHVGDYLARKRASVYQ